jgi:hypothetical protein
MAGYIRYSVSALKTEILFKEWRASLLAMCIFVQYARSLLDVAVLVILLIHPFSG